MSGVTTYSACSQPAEIQPAAWRNPIVHCLPSLTDLVVLLPFVFALASGEGLSLLTRDSDTGWHLRTGEWILQQGRVPVADMFSFTKGGQPWFAWEWLWDAAFGWLHLQAGLAAVALVALAVIGLAFAVTYRTALRRCNHVLLLFGLTVLGVFTSAVHWHARPHLFTFLFTAVFCAVLDRVRDGRTRLLWLLPPLMVLWTNIHGAFLVGLILLGALAVGEFCGWLADDDSLWAARRLRNGGLYLLTAAGCVAATLVNPYGYQLHTHIWRYLFVENHSGLVEEFQSLSFHGLEGILFAALLSLAVLAMGWHFSRKEFGGGFLLLGWSWLALYSARNIPLLALVAIPWIGQAVQEFIATAGVAAFSNRIRRPWIAFLELEAEIGAMERHWRLYLTSLACAGLLIALAYAPNPPARLRAEFSSKLYPVAAVEQYLASLPAPRIFAHDQWGGYLIYRLYPRLRVFTDGRSDFYGPVFIKDWVGIRDGAYDWQERLDKYSIDTVLLPVRASLSSTLKASGRWTAAFDDGTAIVFRRSSELQSTVPVAFDAAGTIVANSAMNTR